MTASPLVSDNCTGEDKGTDHSQNSNGDTLDASDTLDAVILTAVQRETVARSLEIRYLEEYYSEVDDELYQVTAGSLICLGPVETWRRWKVRGEALPPKEELAEPKILWAQMAAERPVISKWDGQRSFEVGPARGQAEGSDRLWIGELKAKADSYVRSGGLNCGLLAAERWLSDYLRQQVIRAERINDQGIELVASPATADVNNRTTVLGFDRENFPTYMSWRRDDIVQVEARTLARVSIGGQQLIARGTIQYRYAPTVRLNVHVWYEHPPHTSEPESLLALPHEVRARNGTIILRDQATDVNLIIGSRDNPAIDSYSLPNTHNSSENTGVPTGNGIATTPAILLAIGLSAIALASVALFYIRKQCQGADCEEQK